MRFLKSATITNNDADKRTDYNVPMMDPPFDDSLTSQDPYHEFRLSHSKIISF